MLARSAPVRPYQQTQINAGSALDVPYRFVDSELAAITLGTDGLRYRIDNLTDGVEILGWTTVTGSPPPSAGTIAIPASLNAMSKQYRDRQLNQVTLESTDAAGAVRQTLYHYELAAVFQGAA